MNNMKKQTKAMILIGISVLTMLLGIGIGSVWVSPVNIVHILANKIGGKALPEDFNMIQVGLVWSIRLPRVLLAFLVGAALAVCGTVMQSVLKNPLASPYGLGVSSGAGLGAAVVMVCGLSGGIFGMLWLPAVSLLSGLVTIVLVIVFTNKIDRNMSNNTIILTGMVFSLFLNAIMTTIASATPKYAQRITLWQLGSLSMKEWKQVFILLLVLLICICFFMSYTRELDIMTFGEEQAISLGIELKKMKWILMGLVAVLTGVTVSFVGIIGFIDMIAPHVVRKFFGSGHKYVLPMSALFGGSFLVLADLVARTAVSPSEIPIGSITALVGAPFFIFVFLQNRRGSSIC